MARAVHSQAFAEGVVIPRNVAGEFNQAEELFSPAGQDTHYAALHLARVS
jgi:hypothetical protein